MDNLDASSFKLSLEIYEHEFEKILIGITACYKMMIKSNFSVPSNDENAIRDNLLNDYLKNNSIRSVAEIKSYLFDKEVPEENLQNDKGRVDIKIQTLNTFSDTNAYYIIECKRLDKTESLNKKYIQEGIMRFVTEKYSSYYGINGMIGFVIAKMNISENTQNINVLLRDNFKEIKTTTQLTHSDFIKDFVHQYYSTHTSNTKKKIKLYHLMFDLSDNLKVQALKVQAKKWSKLPTEKNNG